LVVVAQEKRLEVPEMELKALILYLAPLLLLAVDMAVEMIMEGMAGLVGQEAQTVLILLV
jgi:hypothetical protein